MTIARRALQEFLEQPRDSFFGLKDLTEAQVDDELDKLRPRPDFGDKPLRLHQKVCFLLGVTFPGWYYALDVGMGKTRVVLEIERYHLLQGLYEQGVIFVPTDTSAQGWVAQIERWTPGIPYALLLGSTEEKWDRLSDLKHEGLVIGTYPGMLRMACGMKDVQDSVDLRIKKVQGFVKTLTKQRDRPESVTHEVWETTVKLLADYEAELVKLQEKREANPKKKKSELKLNGKLALDLVKRFGSSTFDEIANIVDPNSLTFTLLDLVSESTDHHAMLAARPFGRNPAVVWPQYWLMDRGESFGPTAGLFREAFFIKRQAYRGHKWNFDKKLTGRFNQFLHHRSLPYTSDEAYDMPPVVSIPRSVAMPNEFHHYHAKLLNAIRRGQEHPGTIYLRLRQLSSGFIGVKDDEDGSTVELSFEENPKLDMMMDDVLSLPREHKALIFHDFTWSGRTISERLTAEGLDHGWVWGGTRDYVTLKHRFDNDPDFRFLVLNRKKGAESLDLQVASYVFFFEVFSDPVKHYQATGRVRRDGQKAEKLFSYEYSMRGTADEAIVEAREQGEDLFREIMADPKRLTRAMSKWLV